MRDLIVNPDSNSIMSFEWMIIDKCNQQCSYCSSKEFNKNDLKSQELYKIGLYKLKTLTQDFKVDIVGGEPTLHKHLKKAVQELYELKNCTLIDICSNMRSPIELYESMNNDKLSITASFHIEYQKGFKEKCLALKHMVNVNINLYPEEKHWSDVKNIIEYCKHNDIPYGYNFLNKTLSYNPTYTSEFFEYFKEYLVESKYIVHQYTDRVEYLSESDLFRKDISYKGFKCSPMQFEIGINGDIHNDCTGGTFKSFNLNNIVQEIICPLSLCQNQIKYKYKKESNEAI